MLHFLGIFKKYSFDLFYDCSGTKSCFFRTDAWWLISHQFFSCCSYSEWEHIHYLSDFICITFYMNMCYHALNKFIKCTKKPPPLLILTWINHIFIILAIQPQGQTLLECTFVSPNGGAFGPTLQGQKWYINRNEIMISYSLIMTTTKAKWFVSLLNLKGIISWNYSISVIRYWCVNDTRAALEIFCLKNKETIKSSCIN